MNFTTLKKLRPAEEIIAEIPLSATCREKIAADREIVKNILQGKDPRGLLIVGPCSAWPAEAVFEYADRLASLAAKPGIHRALKILMRVYIQKPRTARGWTGTVNQPDPFAPPDIAAGIRHARRMMIQVIEKGLAIADEALFPHNAHGFAELLSWVAIGARSSENQEHRIFASLMDCATGIKNPTHGSIPVAINSIVTARHSHHAIFNGHEVRTHGNPYTHLVLRGGKGEPNYSLAHLLEAKNLFAAAQLTHPAILIDASHDNCIFNGNKDYRRQPGVIFTVMQTLAKHPALKSLVKGFMAESFLQAGCQKLEEKTPETIRLDGLSITDPCLGWEETQDMIMHLAELWQK